MGIAQLILIGFAGYFGVGMVFALYFALKGAAKIDASAHGMPLALRLALIPGAAALWPVLVRKTIRSRNQPQMKRG